MLEEQAAVSVEMEALGLEEISWSCTDERGTAAGFRVFTGTPITRGLTIAASCLFGASILTVTYLPQTAYMLAFALVGQLALFLGSGLCR